MSRQSRNQPARQAGPIIPPAGDRAGCETRLPELGRVAAVCLSLSAVTLAVFWPVRGFDFINYDDPVYFSDNERVLTGLTWSNIAWAFRTALNGSWYPLTWLSFMLDVTLFGPGPRGPHLMNLMLHAANGALAFVVLRRMTDLRLSGVPLAESAPEGARVRGAKDSFAASATQAGTLWRSAFVAALFALHPLRVESVAWISERKDVLSGLFFLLTLWAYARYAQCKMQNAKCTIRNYCLALLFFTLGLLSKPMLVTVPFVMLLLDYWPLGRVSSVRCQVSSAGVRDAQVAPCSAGTAIWRRLVLEKLPFLLLALIASLITFMVHQQQAGIVSLASLPLAARIANAFVAYARYLGKTFWPTNLAVFYPHPGYWPAGLVGLGVALVTGVSLAVLWQGRRRPYLAVGWFWFVGMLGPVIGLIQWGGQSLADRFTYAPSIGVFVALVWGVAELWRLSGWPKSVITPAALLVLTGLALGSRAQLGYWRESETLWRHTIELTENNDLAQKALADTLKAKGQAEKAKILYETVLRRNPKYAEAHHSLGMVLARGGQWDEAIRHYQRALAIKPELAEAHNSLGSALAAKGQWAEAASHYQKALALNPEEPAFKNNVAWFWATCPQAALRNAPKAVGLAQAAVQSSGGKTADVLDTLAAAYAEAGRFAEAVASAERALAIAQAQTNRLADEIRARLNLYQRGLPYREPNSANESP
jgi:Flp pilus assembly protein TadD